MHGATIGPGSRNIAGHQGPRRVSRSFLRRYPIVAIWNNFCWWLKRTFQEAPVMEVPKGLTSDEQTVYETLQVVRKARWIAGKRPPRVVAITDLAKDYDDLAAMVLLKELDRLGIVKLIAFVANLMPAFERARFGRGALDSLCRPDIPIAAGTSGFPDGAEKKHVQLAYEFDCNFMARKDDERLAKVGSGLDLLHQVCEEARKNGEKLTLVLISSLEDIYKFSLKYSELLKETVSNVVFQGGYSMKDGSLDPDSNANNNRYDPVASKEFHKFVQENSIPSAVYTKIAAFATPLTADLFRDMSDTGHPLGIHLKSVQVEQDRAFYQTSSLSEGERFAPFMTQHWFLKNKTNWFETHKPEDTFPDPNPQTALPGDKDRGPDLADYLTKVVVYDALAALGASGDDALRALKVLSHGDDPEFHRVVGVENVDIGIQPERMAVTLSALLKGSLLSCQQGIK
jgi:hypothetical protein